MQENLNLKQGGNMEIESLVIFIVIGGVAGWIAGKLMKGRGFGLFGNIIVGIIGALLGGFLFSKLGIAAGGIIGSLIIAVIGAMILVFIIGLFKKI
jgi:uncharacterized membrane protein YeaQ/YmgE (transglycosylase-associated protein family)